MNVIEKAGISERVDTLWVDGKETLSTQALDMSRPLVAPALPTSALPEGVYLDPRLQREIRNSEWVFPNMTVSFLEGQDGIRLSQRRGQDPFAVSIFITGDQLKSIALRGLVLSAEQTGGIRTTRRLWVSTAEQPSPYHTELPPLLRRGVSPAHSPR